MHPSSLAASPRTRSLAVAALADADSLKTSIATDNVAVHTYSGAALNGALANPGPAVLDPPSFVTVTTTTDAATYNITDPIVVTGMRGGEIVTEELMLTAVGGNETITGDQAFDSVTSIYVPIQTTTNGAFTFGTSGIACPQPSRSGQTPFRRIVGLGTGTLQVAYAGGFTDSIPTDTGRVHDCAPVRVLATTDVDFTIYE